MTWLGQLAAYLPTRSPEFDPRPVHVGLALDEVERTSAVVLILRFSPVGTKLVRSSATKDGAI